MFRTHGQRAVPQFVSLLFAAVICSACVAQNPKSLSDSSTASESSADLLTPVIFDTDRGPVQFLSEVVDTPAGRQKGLMFRESLPEKTGMLFVFPNEAQRSFWMRNTLIPLDMIFIKSDKTVLGIVENAEPRTDSSRSVPGASQYVLELIGGSAQNYRLEAGQSVKFVTVLPEQ